MNRANDRRGRDDRRGRVKERGGHDFPLPIPRWMGEVACHVTKNPKCVAPDKRRWQKRRSKPKSPIPRSAISKSGKSLNMPVGGGSHLSVRVRLISVSITPDTTHSKTPRQGEGRKVERSPEGHSDRDRGLLPTTTRDL
jgi:hypothetical protein